MGDKTANPERGEIEIELVTPAGSRKTFVLRPTWEAMVEIETRTGLGMIQIANKLSMLQFGYIEAVAIITAGLKAGGDPARIETVGPMIFKTGLSNLIAPIQTFVQNALTGGESPGEPNEGEVEAAVRPKKKSRTAASSE